MHKMFNDNNTNININSLLSLSESDSTNISKESNKILLSQATPELKSLLFRRRLPNGEIFDITPDNTLLITPKNDRNNNNSNLSSAQDRSLLQRYHELQNSSLKDRESFLSNERSKGLKYHLLEQKYDELITEHEKLKQCNMSQIQQYHELQAENSLLKDREVILKTEVEDLKNDKNNLNKIKEEEYNSKIKKLSEELDSVLVYNSG